MKKKFIYILFIIFTSFFLVSCKSNVNEKRTYKADGTYMAWNLSSTSTTLLNADGVGAFNFKNGDTMTTKKVNTPVLTTVKVTIVNDKIIKYDVDEIASTAKVNYKKGTTDVNLDENGNPLSVTWVFDSKSKKQLEYEYNMGGTSGNQYGSCHEGGICKEWFLQISDLERFWLKSSPETYTIKTNDGITNDENIAGVTISVSLYEGLAKTAISNAKNGYVSAIVPFEHYTYDVCFVNGKINAEGKISDIKLNAQIFGNYVNGEVNSDAFTVGSENYLVFGWNNKDKYASYPEMSNGKTWQSMIDKVNEYINNNGWDGSLTPGRVINEKLVNKGVTNNGKEIEVLSSVTIQLNNPD